jgi:hypothetical protein
MVRRDVVVLFSHPLRRVQGVHLLNAHPRRAQPDRAWMAADRLALERDFRPVRWSECPDEDRAGGFGQ